MTSIWDDPEIRQGGEFIKLDNVGDEVAGTIQAVRRHRFDDGKVVPQLFLLTDGGEERTLTAGQVRLKALLAEQRPEAGDHIRVRLTQIEPRAGGKSLKHFDVEIRRGQGNPDPAPHGPPPAPQQQYAPAPPQGYGQPAAAPQQQYQPPAQAQQQYAPPPAPGYPPQAAYGQPPAQQYAAAPPAPPAPFQAAPAAGQAPMTQEQAAAVAQLTDEEKAALGIPTGS